MLYACGGYPERPDARPDLINLRKQNVATPDPDKPDNLVVQTGEICSRGIELGAEVGQRPEQTARNTANRGMFYGQGRTLQSTVAYRW